MESYKFLNGTINTNKELLFLRVHTGLTWGWINNDKILGWTFLLHFFLVALLQCTFVINALKSVY